MKRKNNAPDQESPADLADRLMSGSPIPSGLDLEDPRLKRTVELLVKARPGAGSDPEMQVRIRSKLIDAWRTAGSKGATRAQSWLSSGQKRRFYAVGLAIVAIIVLSVGLLVAPGSVTGVPAAAQRPVIGIISALAVTLLILGIILWWSRYKRK